MLSRLRRRAWKAGALATVASIVGFTIALAASGGLDPTFSGDGKQITSFPGGLNDNIWGMAQQANGMIVAVGEHGTNTTAITHDFALARYNTDGSLDHTFSSDGLLLTDFGGADNAQDVAITPGGKIVVVGYSCASICKLAVARYLPSGSLDSAFNGTGKKLVAYGSGGDGGSSLALQSDGKMVIAGWMRIGTGPQHFAVFRLNPDGSPDGTFSGDGKLYFGFGSGHQDQANAVRLQGSKILIGGTTCAFDYSACNFAIARLNSNGTLDAAFSGDGKQVTEFGASERGQAIALQPDGRIVMAGFMELSSTSTRIVLARYNTNGSLDTTFNWSGKKVISMGTRSGSTDVLVQTDGKIVVGGWGWNGSNLDMALLRLKPGGSFDGTFSGDGKVTVNFGQNDMAEALLRQGDGKYALGGLTFSPSPNKFALTRILP